MLLQPQRAAVSRKQQTRGLVAANLNVSHQLHRGGINPRRCLIGRHNLLNQETRFKLSVPSIQGKSDKPSLRVFSSGKRRAATNAFIWRLRSQRNEACALPQPSLGKRFPRIGFQQNNCRSDGERPPKSRSRIGYGPTPHGPAMGNRPPMPPSRQSQRSDPPRLVLSFRPIPANNIDGSKAR